MAQPAQLTTGLPGGEYSVIDNSAAPTFPTLDITKEHIGYDTGLTGAIGQDATPILSGAGNGTIPDFVDDSTVILNSSATTRLLFLNPA